MAAVAVVAVVIVVAAMAVVAVMAVTVGWEGVCKVTGDPDGSAEPHRTLVRAKLAVASSGSSTFHFSAHKRSIVNVRLAHVQHSPISSRCLTP